MDHSFNRAGNSSYLLNSYFQRSLFMTLHYLIDPLFLGPSLIFRI